MVRHDRHLPPPDRRHRRQMTRYVEDRHRGIGWWNGIPLAEKGGQWSGHPEKTGTLGIATIAFTIDGDVGAVENVRAYLP